VSIRNADSYNPMEPGINHSSDTAFAAQFRAGVKSSINKNLSLFAEYRFLTIDSTRYRFGKTDYPGLHLPTTPWHVNPGRQKYNLFVAGLQHRF
jgi:opacity protein-like surface antigen